MSASSSRFAGSTSVDSGLLHALLGVPDRAALLAQPWVGASWEGYVIEQILSTVQASGRPHDAWFFRTSDGYEIDLVLELDGTRRAIEIKLTSSPSPADFAILDRAAEMIGATHRVLISQTSVPAGTARRSSHSLPSFLATLRSRRTAR